MRGRSGTAAVCIRTPLVNKLPLVNAIMKGADPQSEECITHEDVEVMFRSREDLTKRYYGLHNSEGVDANGWLHFAHNVIEWSKGSTGLDGDERGRILSAVLWEYGLMTDDYDLFWQKTFDDLEKVRIGMEMAMRGRKPQ